jgi:hypothetical protein
MSLLSPRLQLKVAQKQILTPGLVQMVTVLQLNRLELKEMINQEIVKNPVLEEATEEAGDEVSPAELLPLLEPERVLDPADSQILEAGLGEAGMDGAASEAALNPTLFAETDVVAPADTAVEVPEAPAATDPFDEIDFGSFFDDYLDPGYKSPVSESVEKPSFETIVAAGARSALPHAQPTSARLEPGGLVVIDMGAFEDGYASDMTRMLFIGSPSPKVKRAYRAVLEAQLAGVDAVRPGVTAERVDAAVRRVLKGYGLDRAFIHSTGHGLGLEIHEPPRVGRRVKTRLQPGMAITIEPGVYIEGWGGIRIEDTVAVTENGCEVLTPTSKELRVI